MNLNTNCTDNSIQTRPTRGESTLESLQGLSFSISAQRPATFSLAPLYPLHRLLSGGYEDSGAGTEYVFERSRQYPRWRQLNKGTIHT